jgi:uncharacterized coiled-coil DUF342 family protein
MTETAMSEGRDPTTAEMREFREQVRQTRESLEWTQSRLQRQTMPETERDKLVREWNAAGQGEVERAIGWRIQSLKQEEERLVEYGSRAAFDPTTCLDILTAALDGDEPPTRHELRDELAYVTRELRDELAYVTRELRRANSSVRVY